MTDELGAQTATEPKDAETTRRIVDGLFPIHSTRTNAMDNTESLVAPIFTAEEVTRTAKAMKVGKASGRDGIPREIIRLMVNLRP